MALRVLLADESSTIKKVIQLALQDFGVEVKSVPVGIDVLPLAKSFHPDIILADVLLAKKSGYEICAEIKNDPELKHIPTVLMWSGFMELDEAKTKTARPDRRLEKPFDADTLRRLVKELVPTTQSNVIASYLSFPELPEIVDESRGSGKDAGQSKSSSSAVASPSFPNSGTRRPLPGARPSSSESNSESRSSQAAEPPMVVDYEEPEDFQQVPLPKASKSSPSRDSRDARDSSQDSDLDEAWSHQDLNKFKVELPQDDDFSINLDEDALTRTSIALSDSTDEVELGEIDNAEVKIKRAPLAGRIAEAAKSARKSRPPEPMEASPVYVDTDRAEEIIREEARAILKEIAWAMLPDICERVVREELQKLLKDAERL